MAGYQRHRFETTQVTPGSDGGWGAFAKGFSNGHSIGKAIGSAINQRNISEANEQYGKDIEAARQQTLATEVNQQAIDANDVMGGIQEKDYGANGVEAKQEAAPPERAIKMTDSQLANLSPEGQQYFKDYYAKQEDAGNKGEYRYDKLARAQMEADAGQRRDKAIKDSFLRWEGDQAYRQYRAEELEHQKTEDTQAIMDMYKRPDWYAQEGVADRLNNLSTYMGAMLGNNYGKFEVVDGKLYNDTGKGAVEVTGNGLSMLKRLAQTDEIWDKTGNSEGFIAAMEPIKLSESLGLQREALKLKGMRAMAGAGEGNGQGIMKDTDMIKLLEMGYKKEVDARGNEFMVSPDGSIQLPTRRSYAIPTPNKNSQSNQNGKGKPAPKKEDKPSKKQAIPTANGD